MPFLVWTDHKNLEYLQSAKCLNSRQARWALFLTRFNFVLSCRPGSHNTKPDSLSRQFSSAEDTAVEPETILTNSHMVAILTWEVEERVKSALEDNPGPSSCPANLLYVPQHLRPDVLQLIHGSKLTCHPGIQRTKEILQQRLWWSTLEEDTRDFVNACSVCN